MSNEIVTYQSTDVIVNNTDDLSRVVVKALQEIEKILDAEEPTLAADKLKLMSIKKDAASAIINAGLKADENRFRRENKDIVERLFAKIQNHGKLIDGKVVHKA